MSIRIILFLILVVHLDLAAEFLPSKAALRSVVVLTDNRGSACASGFLTDQGKLITASHVVQSLCSRESCDGLVVKRSSTLHASASETVLPSERVRVEANIPWLDLAILEGGFPKGSFSLNPHGDSAELNLLSFPRCRELTFSKGTVTRYTPIWIDTSVEAAPGSSGGVGFDNNYNVVGVAQQATSAKQAIMARLYGTTYNLRFLEASFLLERLKGPGDNTLETEIEALYRYYREEVLPLRQWDRLIQSADFVSTVLSLKSNFSVPQLSPDRLIPFLALGDYAGAPQRKIPPGATRKLVLAANLESHGLFKKFMVPLDLTKLNEDLTNQGLTSTEILEITNLVTEFKQSAYHGFDLFILKKVALWLLIFCLLAFAIGSSAGYIFALTQGSFLRRILITLFWGVLCWPVSILVFAIVKRRSHN